MEMLLRPYSHQRRAHCPLIQLIASSSGSLPSRPALCASGSFKIINQAGLFADLAIKSRVRGKAAPPTNVSKAKQETAQRSRQSQPRAHRNYPHRSSRHALPRSHSQRRAGHVLSVLSGLVVRWQPAAATTTHDAIPGKLPVWL